MEKYFSRKSGSSDSYKKVRLECIQNVKRVHILGNKLNKVKVAGIIYLIVRHLTSISYSNSIIQAKITKLADIISLYCVLYLVSNCLKQSPINDQAMAPETPINAIMSV